MISVVVIVGLAWAIFFGPSVVRAIRKEFDRYSGGSIGEFNRSLSAFNTQKRNRQASKQMSTDQISATRNRQSGEPLMTNGSGKKYGKNLNDRSETFAHNRQILLKEQMQERRRFVLLLMGTLCILTGILGMIPALEILWIITAISAVLIFCYVGLIKYYETLETEKLQKLTPIASKKQTPVSPSYVQNDNSVVIVGKISSRK